MSFPLVGNPSESPLVKGVRGLFKERFWTSQNDRIEKLKQLLRYLMINSILSQNTPTLTLPRQWGGD
jgi:hypothetical protein